MVFLVFLIKLDSLLLDHLSHSADIRFYVDLLLNCVRRRVFTLTLTVYYSLANVASVAFTSVLSTSSRFNFMYLCFYAWLVLLSA
jgi:hypothetical protein